MSQETPLTIEPLGDHHDRAAFSCGKDRVDEYLRTQARQDHRRKTNFVHVLVMTDKPNVIVGYHTLCSKTVSGTDLPSDVAKKLKLASRHEISVTLIGWFGIDARYQKRKLSDVLLMDALGRSYESATRVGVGSVAVVVDAIDDDALAFWEYYGFIRFPDQMRLFLPMTTVERLLKDANLIDSEV